ncbi:MAG: TonB-dependent receptor [Prevotellaceae bacterium]|jgi:outer membrane receptor protein involved in Fe transport|nr:TonB-dependent receptor [Prevotellaceae bacterium]
MKHIIVTFSLIFLMSDVIQGQDMLNSPDTTTVRKYTLDEAVVYSFHEGSEVKKLPASTSVVTQTQLERNRIKSLKDLTSYVSNFFMPDYGSQLTSPVFIRGIGSRINSPSIGLYVDHIPYFDKATFDFDLYDIQYIEVLRGPQGTLYGRNTMGGIINVFSLSPENYQGTRINLSGDNYTDLRGGFSHYKQAGEKTSYSIALNYSHNRGYFTNIYNNEKVGKTHIGSGKLRLIHRFSDAVRAEVFTQYEHNEQDGYPYAMLDKNNASIAAINYDEPSLYNRDFFTVGGIFEWKTKEFVLRSTTAYSYIKDKQQVDQDFTPLALCLATQQLKHNMVSEEIILKSDTDRNYQWLFGTFVFWQQADQNVFLDFKKDAVKQGMFPAEVTNNMNYDNPTYGWAVFHQSKYDNLFTKGLSLAAGVRLDGEYAKSDYTQIVLMKQNGAKVSGAELNSKLDYLQFIPKFTVNYKPVDVYSVYASVAKGYKTGGFNSAPEDLKDVTFDPEYSWNYEAGIKLNFFDGRLGSEASVFLIDWRDQQIYQFNPNGVGSILRNAGKSASKGFELLLKIVPVRLLSITASYGYTHATFKDYKNKKGDVVIDFGGNYIPYVPRNTVSVNANYPIYFNSGFLNCINLNVQYLGAGSLYWDEENLHKQSYYNQFNTRVAFKIFNIAELGVWAQNIFDTKYQTFYFEALSNSFVQHCKPFLIGLDFKLNL